MVGIISETEARSARNMLYVAATKKYLYVPSVTEVVHQGLECSSINESTHKISDHNQIPDSKQAAIREEVTDVCTHITFSKLSRATFNGLSFFEFFSINL